MYYANVQYNNEFQLCFQIQIFMANCGPKITYSYKNFDTPKPFFENSCDSESCESKGFFFSLF